MRTISENAEASPDRHAATRSASRLAGSSRLSSPVIGTSVTGRRLQEASDADHLEVCILEQVQELVSREARLGRDLDVAPFGLRLQAVVLVDPVLRSEEHTSELQSHSDLV